MLAVVPQRNNLDRSLNVRQNLLFHAAYHGVGRAERRHRADEILDRMGLAEQASNRIDFVSGGQSQRVMIARALMHQPKVMFLDEPSTGLDPQARLFVHDRIDDLRADGVTVVLTTHDMDEAAKLCDRIGIVDHGKLLALDKPSALTRSLPGSATVTATVNLDGIAPEQVRATLSGITSVQRVEQISTNQHAAPPGMPPGMPGMPTVMATPTGQDASKNGQFRLYTENEPAVILPVVLSVLSGLNCEVTDLSVGAPSLEDVFIHLTGRDLR